MPHTTPSPFPWPQDNTGAEAAAFFNAYSAAFAAYDAARVAELFDLPLTVLTAERPVAYGSREQVAPYVQGLLDTYRGIGLAWPVPAAVWAWPCGGDLARVEVLWLLRNAEQAEIMRFSTSYLLRRAAPGPDGWKLSVVVSYEEPVKLPAAKPA
ncbi:hypothetical protein [Indioceanicola profundi]|uniref:hypothetical protein n=1 Tax=Indioceanicola profundi TaxID=2220096 RepID=UPI000E6ACF96|nr:hypothetical protein [Indioceanicola profundi]